jgi:type VI secretion system protein ImpK
MGRLDIPEVSKAFFTTVIPFRTEEGKARYDAEGLKQTIREVMAAQEAAAGARRIDFEVYDHARYAMIGLIDELAIVSEWPYRTDWAQEPMELAVFNSNVAGEDFFERIDTLRKRYANSRDENERDTILGALEVFYTCLECGFKGRFRGGGEGELTALRTGLLAMLWPQSDSREHKPLFPDAYSEATKADKRALAMNKWPFILVGALVLLVGIYIFYTFALGGRARDIEKTVESHVDKSLGTTGVQR